MTTNAKKAREQRDKTTVNVRFTSSSGSFASRTYAGVSLPAQPWGDIQPDNRAETAPRSRSYMVSSRVTRAERMEREMWEDGV